MSFDIYSKDQRVLDYDDIYDILKLLQGHHIHGSSIEEKAKNLIDLIVPDKGHNHYMGNGLKKVLITKEQYMSRIYDLPNLIWPIFELQVRVNFFAY